MNFAPVLPRIIGEFGLSLAAAGLLFPMRGAGGFLGGLVAGPLVDRHGTKPVVAAAQAAAIAGHVTAALAPSWAWVIAGLTLAEIGQRALATCLSTLVAGENSADPARLLNYLHAVYGLGALAAPLGAGAWIAARSGWRAVFLGAALLWIVLLAATIWTAYPPLKSRGSRFPVLDRGLFGNELFLALFAVAFCYNGVATPLLAWINTYLDRTGAVDPFWASSMLSVFYAALTAGRLACGALAARFGFERTILTCSVAAAIAYPIVIAAGRPLILAAGVLLSGLFLSGLFPTALAIASRAFKERPGTATALLSTAMTLGSLLPPWWTGAIADLWSFRGALGLNGGLFALMLTAAVHVYRARSGPDQSGEQQERGEGSAAAGYTDPPGRRAGPG